jgi:hypothetical protein
MATSGLKELRGVKCSEERSLTKLRLACER